MTIATRVSSAAALATLALITGAAAASAGPVDPAANNPAYYEEGGTYECSKIEYADGMKSFTRATGVAFYVVKAGTGLTIVDGGSGSGYDTYTSNKDISFIITCVPTYGGGGS